MTLVVLFCMTVYIVLSIVFVSFIAVKITKRPIYTALAIAFVILLPTWDVLLGALVYFPACLVIPKVVIYETAETEGIYYEGEHDYVYEWEKQSHNQPRSERTRVGTMSDVFRGGYTYVESKVVKEGTERYSEYRPITPVYYRCILLPKNPEMSYSEKMSCVVVDKPMSRYMVKTIKIEIGTAELIFDKIIDKYTGKLMGENRSATLLYSLPFFYWFYKTDGPPQSISCSKWRMPKGVYYHPFEFDVLKPKSIK